MKVILKQDVKSVGKQGDAVQVATGYARNYLLPKNLAVEANDKNLLKLDQEKQVMEKKQGKVMKEAQKLAGAIEKISCTILAKVGDTDKMFGQVGTLDIVDALASKGIQIEKKQVLLEEPIRELGVYTVPVKLYVSEADAEKKVIAKLKVWVVKE
ncbi:MAG: 50S ribosomal protein L9 [bacterium]